MLRTSSAQFNDMEVVSYEEQRKEPDQTPGSNTRKPEAYVVFETKSVRRRVPNADVLKREATV